MFNNTSPELSRIIALGKAEAKRRGDTEIGSRHLLFGLIHDEEGNGRKVLSRLNVNLQDLEGQVFAATDGSDLVSNSMSTVTTTADATFEPTIGRECDRILRLANIAARLQGNKECDGSHLLLGILRDMQGNQAKTLLGERDVNYRKVAGILMKGRGGSPSDAYSSDSEDFASGELVHAGSERDSAEPEENTDTPFINQYGRDLTAAALAGAMDPLVGRTRELQRVIQILQRRKKNNPILVGEPGTGKSAIVEGLAALIAAHHAGSALEGHRVVAVDMAQIVAGTQYRGQFEERLRRLIAELRQHPEIILAIDEIHTIVGAGSAPGTLDAANILKPALARGEIRCVGTTTTAEYRKSIEKDGALDRRFQQVRVEPTTPDETLLILQNLRERYESHHGVTYTPEALQACVALTERYVNTRHFPDKAIDALDEAGAQAHAVSAEVPPRMKELIAEAAALREKIKEAVRQEDYGSAVGLRESLVEVQREVDAASDAWRKETESTQKQVVTADDVARVVSMMSRVPVQRMQQDERQMLRHLAERLGEKVIAQDEAIAQLSRAIQRSRLGLKDPGRPIGVFMFVGPTGVGKTHLAKSLAVEMFGSPDALIRIDMSEFGEKHTGARLVGAPPGYVGYDEGGQLTEKVRRRPYSIILLDEIEKAHPDVFNLLLQVMDEGRLTDGNGVTVDFRHTVIIMTSNSGSRQIRDFGAGVGFSAPAEADAALIASTTRKALERQFAPEFLNRLDDIIMFHPLSRDAAARIVRIEVDALLSRLREGGTQVIVDEAVYGHIAQTGYESRYGARSLKRTIQEKIETPLCAALMEDPLPAPPTGESPQAPSTFPNEASPIHITVEDNKIKIY